MPAVQPPTLRQVPLSSGQCSSQSPTRTSCPHLPPSPLKFPCFSMGCPPQHLLLSWIFICPAAGLQWASALPWSTSSCDLGVPLAVSHFFSLALFFQHFLPSPQHVSTEAPAALLTGSTALCIPEPSVVGLGQLWPLLTEALLPAPIPRQPMHAPTEQLRLSALLSISNHLNYKYQHFQSIQDPKDTSQSCCFL